MNYSLECKLYNKKIKHGYAKKGIAMKGNENKRKVRSETKLQLEYC